MIMGGAAESFSSSALGGSAVSSSSSSSSSSYTHQGVVYSIPTETCAPFGSYPNPLGLTDEDRAQFHPVVLYPNHNNNNHSNNNKLHQQPEKKDDDDSMVVGIVGKNHLGISILDHTRPSGKVELATQQQRELAASGKQLDNVRACWHDYGIGRYDENRVHMYRSELFDDTTNAIDGFDGARTLHVGIDLDGPLYTPVYAFWHGTVHAIGYNADLGDYGNVVVVKHELPPPGSTTDRVVVVGDDKKGEDEADDNSRSKLSDSSSHHRRRIVYALYGHLADFGKVPTTTSTTNTSTSLNSSSSNSSSRNTAATTTTTARNVGDTVRRGDILGHLGNIHENGGWRIPHVHFQLALEPPATHDMPGAVAMNHRPTDDDRARALVLYPDPRYVLGPLH
jgi:murein DD-endopeptidase MepM/ murein hydrolase activator NlpD